MSKPLVTLTTRCASYIASKIKNKYQINYTNSHLDGNKNKNKNKPSALRILVDSGGCNEYSYHYNFTNEIENNDITINQGGAKVVIDQISGIFLKDAVIDYRDELIKSGFNITNPNITSSCGCQNSFSY